jgi:GTP-binding protein Era
MTKEKTENPKQNKKIAEKFKVAKIAIIGRPNAGKSTLLNALMQSELCATSDRPQTSRRKISGVLQRYSAKKWSSQIVLMDTPGINFQKGALERSFFSAVEASLSEADAVVWLADARSFEKDLLDLEMEKVQEDRVANWLKETIQNSDQPWILVLNKADLINKSDLLPLMDKVMRVLPEFKEIVPISAAAGLKNPDSNLEGLLGVLDKFSRERDPLFDQEAFTDISAKEMLREFVREAIFKGTMKEVPYETECTVVRFQEPTKANLKPEADVVIWVSRPSLKGIIVGAQGKKIKEIGMSARNRYKEVTGQEIIVRTFVKVVDRWERRSDLLGELGYGTI